MVLTAKQQAELDGAILQYLKERAPQSAATLQTELKLADDDAHVGLLEKKWTSVIRLQKKVMDLEEKVIQLTDEVFRRECMHVFLRRVFLTLTIIRVQCTSIY